MEEENDLPLFLNCSDAIGVYVIANKILGMSFIGYRPIINSFSFDLICKLANSTLTNTAIPTMILKKYRDFFAIYKTSFPCFIGGIVIEDYFCDCLVFKMRTLDNFTTKNVVLYNVALLDSRASNKMYINRLEDEIFLTAAEAFHLFANICLTGSNIRIYEKDITNPFFVRRSSYDLSIYKKNEDGSENFPPSFVIIIESFCEDYYNYLENQITQNKLSLDFLLRLNGQYVIAYYLKDYPIVQQFIREKINLLLHKYDELTINQKITYFTLLLEAEDMGSIPEIDDLVKENKAFIDTISKALLKPFPKGIGSEISRDEAFLEYISSDYRSYMKLK